jgi:sugar transferase (PEP-CTERM/EpsH1 system associated)
MNILFACHRMPSPPSGGAKIRAFHMICHLGQKHSVSVVTLAHTQDELREGEGLRQWCIQVLAEVLPASVRWRQAALAFAAGRSSSMAYFWSSRLYDRVREAARQTPFDAVIAHCAFAAPYVADVPAALRLLDFCDIDSGKWLDYARHFAFPLSAGYGVEARRLRAVEKDLASRFDQCTVVTPGELEQFRALGARTPCRVLPNGVDLAYFRREQREPGESRVIVFMGRMDYFPNVQGIVKFAREALPLIRQSVPGAELRIIGAEPARSILELAKRPGVTVTGAVPDVRPYLRDAAVAIAPLYVARGTQNKILEAMAAGIPVITTPLAAKGVEAVPGRDLLVAETGAEFAAQVVRLLQSPELRRELAGAALEQVAAAHSWSATLELLDGLLDSRVLQAGA